MAQVQTKNKKWKRAHISKLWAEVLQAGLTCDMKKDWHWYLGLGVDLALVLAQVPQLRVADLQGPGVGLRAVQAAEPIVPCS